MKIIALALLCITYANYYNPVPKWKPDCSGSCMVSPEYSAYIHRYGSRNLYDIETLE
jgi:hypothetical protein